jgi:hypothetical protein
MGFLEEFFLPQKHANEFSFQRYLRDLDGGTFRDKMCLGVCEAHGGSYLLKSFAIEPNAIFVGAMGSGKSFGALFSLITWLASNSDQTIVFLIDAVKGANDYRALFKYQESGHVYPILSSEMGIHRVIDLVYDEAMARRELFNSHKAESINAYEKITGKKMARIIMMMEEFHSIPYSILDFERNYKVAGTTANKFHTIMRIGRSMGTWVMAASQRSTKSDIPPEIVPNFTQKQIFRVTRAEAAYILGSSKAADITSEQKGRCETDYGTVQFPYMPIESQVKLLDKYIKPMDAECAYLTPQVISDYLGGKSTDELYKLKKLSDLVQNIENVDGEIVVGMMHKALRHKVESVDSQTDHNGISHIVTWASGVRVAVMIRSGPKIKILPKHIGRLRIGMEKYECERGILYTSATDLQVGVYNAAQDAKVEIVDHEDFLRLARQIEANVVVPENISPSELADPLKESGEYQKTHHVEPPKLDKTEHGNVLQMPLRPVLKDILPPTNKLYYGIKLRRIPVKLQYIPPKDEQLTISVHIQKTKKAEIYRILFYVINEPGDIIHRYYVDHKLSSMLDEETAAALDISDAKEWNKHKETLLGPEFENKIVSFFSNFNVLPETLRPCVMCWSADAGTLAQFMKKVPIFKNSQPTEAVGPKPFGLITYEDLAWENIKDVAASKYTNEVITKDLLMNILVQNPDRPDMFFPIERDRLILGQINKDPFLILEEVEREQKK